MAALAKQKGWLEVIAIVKSKKMLYNNIHNFNAYYLYNLERHGKDNRNNNE